MLEDMYMNGAETARYLIKRREEMQDFLTYIGIGPKPQ